MDAKNNIIANWNEFDEKVAKPLVGEVLVKFVADEIGKLNAKKAKPWYSFKSETLKMDRLKVLTGLTGVAGGAVATGAAATAALAVAPVILTLTAIVGTLSTARKLSLKTYSDMGIVRKRVDKELETVTKALSKLEPQLNTLEMQKQKLGLLMVKSEVLVKQAYTELKKLKKSDVKELDFEKKVNELQSKFDNSQKSLIEERKKRDEIVLDLKSVRALVDQAQRVSDQFDAASSFYDKGLAACDGSSTELGAATKVLGTLTKLL